MTEPQQPQQQGNSTPNPPNDPPEDNATTSPLIEDLFLTDPDLKQAVLADPAAASAIIGPAAPAAPVAPPPVVIRPATGHDLPAINDIYNAYVRSSTCTFQLEEETLKARETWFASHGTHRPVVVAEMAGQVVGWAALSRFHPRAAYRYTVEDSVYVHEDHRGLGIGTALLAKLIERAEVLKLRSIVAVIAADQPASIKLHEKFGFEKIGTLKEAGKKFGRWLDVVYMQRMV